MSLLKMEVRLFMSKKFAVYGVLFTLGLGLGAYSFYKLDFNVHNIPLAVYGEQVVGSSNIESSEISEIVLIAAACEVKVEVNPEPTTEIVVKYEYYDNIKFDITNEEGKLTISSHNKFVWWNVMNVVSSCEIEVLVPQNYVGNYRLDVAAGQMDVKNVTADTINIYLGAGEINATNINVSTLNARIAAGDLTIKESTMGKLNATISAGALRAYHSTCDIVDFKISAGSLNMELIGNINDYNVSVKISAGSCNISDRITTGSLKSITGKISAGDARFKFVEN